MNKTLIILLLVLSWASSNAQQMSTLSGTVKDKATGETLIGAIISIEEKHTGTSTNEYGFYSISLRLSHNKLEFTQFYYSVIIGIYFG